MLLAAVITAGVLALYHLAWDRPIARNLEAQTLDLRFRLRGADQPGPETVIVMIDDETVRRAGQWPIPRRRLAALVDRLSQYGARVIAFDLLFVEPEPRYPAAVAAALARAAESLEGDGGGKPTPIHALLREPAPDTQFGRSLAEAGKALLPFAFTFAPTERPPNPLPPSIEASAYRVHFPPPGGGEPVLPAAPTGAAIPIDPILSGAVAVGHVSLRLDTDASARFDYPVFEYDWLYYPSLPVAVVRQYLDLSPDQVAVHFGLGIHLGDRFLPTDEQMQVLLNYHGPGGTFPTFAFDDVMADDLDPDLFRDKIVLVGASVVGSADVFATPFTQQLPGVERLATAIDRILHGPHLVWSGWVRLADMALLVAFGLAAAALAGGLPTLVAIPACFLLLAGWGAVSHLAFAWGGVWLNFLFPTLAIGANTGALAWARVAREETERRLAEEALRRSEERYALAARGANDGLWDWDLASGHVFYSPRWLEMVGEDATEPDQGIDFWFDRIATDDREPVKTAIRSHLDDRTSHLEIEYRIRHPDGDDRWMLARGLAVRDRTGKPTRLAGSQTDVTMRRRFEEKILHDAFHDGLTSLSNHAMLSDRLDRAATRLRSSPKRQFGLLRINLDGFRRINDTLGQPAGDRILITMARRLEPLLRPNDSLARLSADEFGILADPMDGPEPLIAYASQVLEVIAEPVTSEDRTLTLTASIGLVAVSDGDHGAADLLRDANLAVHQAKQNGGNRAELFTPALYDRAIRRFDLEAELRSAVGAGCADFELNYQPILRLANGRPAGAEALIRWRHPQHGMISPGEFIPLAEETGLIVELGGWILDTACRQAAEWERRGLAGLSIAVNVSGRQFSDPTLLERLSASLERSRLSPGCLKIEVTESMVMDHPERVGDILRRIRALGVRVSIDDFGTGYSSLSYLHRFPFDTLKIDRSFVQRIGEVEEALEIVRVIAALAQTLRRDIVAEGIETRAQADALHSLKVDFGQGFLFARPMPAPDASKVLFPQLRHHA